MKAVIALSGLAGMLLFGPGLRHSHNPTINHVVHVDTHAVAHVAMDVQSQCNFEDELTLSMAVGAGDALKLIAGAGSLEVTGVDGLREMRAVARVCASHEEFLEELDLTAEMSGSDLVVETHYPDISGRSGWGNRYARLDLRIEVPEGMVADIEDSSGEMFLTKLGALTIKDSSGGIEARSIRGSVWIDDSSGEIGLWDITGDVDIEDGSGEIGISGVGGGVTLFDGSGEIEVEDVEGDVRVVRDGSGSIDVDGVGGDFIVERDGSGSIDFHNVRGTVDVPRRRR